jgi:hypothetical protein
MKYFELELKEVNLEDFFSGCVKQLKKWNNWYQLR